VLTTSTTEVWEPYAEPIAGPVQLIECGGLTFRATAEDSTARLVGGGIIELVLTSADGPVRAEWRLPCVDVTALWTPDTMAGKGIPAAWSAPKEVSLSRGAPIASLIGTGDVGRCTFAAAEVDVLAAGGVFEETGEFRFWVQAQGRLTLRVDVSGRHFARCLADLTAWWLADRGIGSVDIPATARKPAYSTWYSMHQAVTPEAVEEQARLGKALGLDLIIVDDGWMTLDRGRGYGHTGDWEPLSLPDTAAHVARVHDLGVEYMLWYAIPFIGKESTVWERFQPYALSRAESLDAMIVDPRCPAVRAYLADLLCRAVEEWGMDGLKIDFLDWFAREEAPPAGPEADCATVSEGVDKLLGEIRTRITAVRPTALVEFRQPYVSPGLWPHATMLRATDCPLSGLDNRQRTTDVRLAAGPIPVHADMLMWHPEEPAEQVACHLINVLFAVPQISVDLATLTPEQHQALVFWLGIFRRYEQTLQLGAFEPARPDLGYPLIRAHDARVQIVARHAALPVSAAGAWDELLVANADTDPWVRLTDGSGSATVLVRDARGRSVWAGSVDLDVPGGAVFEVPRGGLAELSRDAVGRGFRRT
jgi:alpha-galactosidase